MIGQTNHQFLFFLLFAVNVALIIIVGCCWIIDASGSADSLDGELDFLFRRLERFAHLSGHLAASGRLVALVDDQRRRKVNRIRSRILIQIFYLVNLKNKV